MKILSISNNLLSLNNANGKFCRNYLNAFEDEELASFYISNDLAEPTEAIESFNYTDSMVLDDFFHKKKKEHTSPDNRSNVRRKSAVVRIIRYFVWKIGFRKNKSFFGWVDNINPTHIVLTVGDNPYLFHLARKIKKRFNSKLIIICGENYALKKYDYLLCKRRRSISFLLFQRILKNKTKKCFKSSGLVIFNSEDLKELYEKKMHFTKSIVVYPLSSNNLQKSLKPENNDVVYAGNLGVGRAEELVNFGRIMKRHDNNRKLVVYGKGSEEQISILKRESNILYKGVVSNTELIEIINKSWLLLHVESFDEYRKMDLKYAFSTKLSDLIASNNRFFMYAPDCYVESKFFIKYVREHIALNENELEKTLSVLIKEKVPFLSENNSAIREKMDINKNAKLIRDLVTSL